MIKQGLAVVVLAFIGVGVIGCATEPSLSSDSPGTTATRSAEDVSPGERQPGPLPDRAGAGPGW